MFDQDLTRLIGSFWQSHDRFLKNALITEQPHPQTAKLSELAQTNLAQAIRTLLEIDISCLKNLTAYQSQLEALHDAISYTIKSGHKVFIAGCGASGRLAASLEYCWNKYHPEHSSQIVSLIAGGDAALIRSIERCEDYPEYGIKQLQQQGFSSQDLLISTTASGESPFILGATNYAAEICETSPWLLYCNSDESLLGRNPEHPISNPLVKGLYIDAGPMALTGSTRMQATTAMLLAIGLSLFYSKAEIGSVLQKLVYFLEKLDLSPLVPLIKAEANCYQNKKSMLYQSEADFALSILTDTTERSPTFNLIPFENSLDTEVKPSWVYLSILDTDSAASAWQALLNRPLVALNWPELPATSSEHLTGFNLSEDYGNTREHALKLSIKELKHAFHFSLSGESQYQFELSFDDIDFFGQQIILKLVLNIASTLVMGRLGFYQGNLMTSLYPSNHKLIDRAIRYVRFLYQQSHGKILPYETVADAVFTEMKSLTPGESIVNKALKKLT
ncbi:MAG: hypothetical protein K0R66_688 [Gammaproteobacteria bacterium]|jgi:N-acetylmuramic acid 6-phosphate etherase|nr:hypothetical protein [Gammaproteobacteria bacterium]